MKMFKSTFYPLSLELIKWALSCSFLLIGVDDKWALLSMKNAGLALGSMFIYLVTGHVLQLRRPLVITVNVCNKVSNEKHTQINAQSNSSEVDRTVRAVIKIDKRLSIFTWLYRWLIKDKQCTLLFDTVPEGQFVLQPDRTTIVSNDILGFRINLTDIILQSLNEDAVEIERTVDFVIFNCRDTNLMNNAKIDIKSEYKIDNKKIGFIHSLFYDIKSEWHNVRYFDGYMGVQNPVGGGRECLLAPDVYSSGS